MKLEIKSATDDTGFDVFMGDKKIGIIRDEDWLEGETHDRFLRHSVRIHFFAVGVA